MTRPYRARMNSHVHLLTCYVPLLTCYVLRATAYVLRATCYVQLVRYLRDVLLTRTAMTSVRAHTACSCEGMHRCDAVRHDERLTDYD
jgi:hypothetical protein